jgi:N-methylhydantoinase A/oxoprolinase/acetone carboxylase beta subunit
VVPLCTLAEQYPEVIDTLGLISKLFQFEKSDLSCGNPCCFYVKSPVAEDLPDKFSNIKYEGPINEFLFIKKSDNVLALRELKELERKGLLIKCGLTPTDIRIASGLLEFGSRDAAIIGLKVFSHYFGSTEAELAESVEEEIRKRLCMETIAFVGGKDAPAVNKIADRWFPQDFGHTSSKIGLGVTVSLSVPVIGTGAPAGLCLPATFNRLRTHCITPESYEVAVAIGAVVGMVDFTVKGIIRKSDSGRFTLHTDAGKEDIVTKDEAVIQGKQILESIAKAKMSRDHVSTPLFKFTQNEKKFKTGYGEEVFLELELRLRATGRPDINTWILESEIKEMEKQSGSVVA